MPAGLHLSDVRLLHRRVYFRLELFGQTHDAHIQESAHDHPYRLFLGETAGHEVFYLVLGDLADRRFVRHLHVGDVCLQLWDGDLNALVEDQALAFEMAPCAGSFPLDITPGYDCPASRDGTGDQLRTGARWRGLAVHLQVHAERDQHLQHQHPGHAAIDSRAIPGR